MGDLASDAFGLEFAPITIDQCTRDTAEIVSIPPGVSFLRDLLMLEFDSRLKNQPNKTTLASSLTGPSIASTRGRASNRRGYLLSWLFEWLSRSGATTRIQGSRQTVT